MFKDLEIIQKLYSIKSILTDIEEIKIIEELISKRKTYLNLESSYNYTKRELSRMTDGVRKCYFEAIDYCIEIYDKEPTYDDKFEEIIIKKFREFEILKLKIHKEKNTLISNTAKESLKIFMKEEFIKIILKN